MTDLYFLPNPKHHLSHKYFEMIILTFENVVKSRILTVENVIKSRILSLENVVKGRILMVKNVVKSRILTVEMYCFVQHF